VMMKIQAASWGLVLMLGMGLVATTVARGEPSDEKATVQKDEKAAKKYRRSKLTRDESEAKADKRKLLLTTGEDKVVDVDFEVTDYLKHISIGNNQVVAVTLVKLENQRQIIFKPLKAGERRDDPGRRRSDSPDS